MPLPFSSLRPRVSPEATSKPASLDPQSPLHSHPLFQRRRRIVLVGAVAVITITGSLLGASLKSRQQYAEKVGDDMQQTQSQPRILDEVHAARLQESQQQQTRQDQIDTHRQLQLLETRRGQLMQQKIGLEKKIGEVRERMANREMERKRVEKLRGFSREEQGVNRG